jgi:hypothetical protein
LGIFQLISRVLRQLQKSSGFVGAAGLVLTLPRLAAPPTIFENLDPFGAK